MGHKKQGIGLAMLAFGLFIVGGIATFGGLALVGFMPTQDIFGWGSGRGFGYLALCVGLCLSILGVLLMRIFRNRGFS